MSIRITPHLLYLAAQSQTLDFLLKTMAALSSTLETSAPARQRNARRSSIPCRVIVGLDSSFVSELEADDRDFFGSDGSDCESEPGVETAASIQQEQPALQDRWSSDEDAEAHQGETAAAATEGQDADVFPADLVRAQLAVDKGCECEDVQHVAQFSPAEFAVFWKQFAMLFRSGAGPVHV